jgi:hypothetical protein|tara:strand:- start:38 stop:214 length:177 start_codon:yes stop_codon:yes gene_type:complete
LLVEEVVLVTLDLTKVLLVEQVVVVMEHLTFLVVLLLYQILESISPEVAVVVVEQMIE